MPDLVVLPLADLIRPHLSDAAREAFLFGSHEPLDDMVVFARWLPAEPTEDDARRLGMDLSRMVEALGPELDRLLGTPRSGLRAVHGAVCAPLLVPVCLQSAAGFAPDGFAVLMHARVRRADRPDVRVFLRAWCVATFGVHALGPGELPPHM